MNLVDSSAWLEYFTAGANARAFASPIENLAKLVVPSVCLYEVFKSVARQKSDREALEAVAIMEGGRVVDMTAPLAVRAARASLAEGLPLADSVILATAREYGATLWTQDADFEGKRDVRFFRK